MQKKYKFDKDSLIKIGKGALIAGTGGVALYTLNAFRIMEFDYPLLTSFVALIVPFLTNVVKEFIKGE